MPGQEEKLFAEIRSILHDQQSERGWQSFISRASGPVAQSELFEQNYAPAVHALLDNTWPDARRIASQSTPIQARKYARVFVVSTPGGQVTKKQIAAVAKEVKAGVPKGHYRGLFFDRVRGYPAEMLDAIIKSKAVGPITHFFSWMVDNSNASRSSKSSKECVEEMIALLLDRDAANLEGFGGDLGRTAWRLVTERVQELRHLDTLWGEPSMLMAFLDELTPLQIKRIGLMGSIDGGILEDLIEHEFADHVETISGHWRGPHLEFQRWAEQYSAKQVQRWCIHDQALWGTQFMQFDMERAKYWSDRLHGVRQHPLEDTSCVLDALDPEALHELLFDENSQLRPSSTLEALVIPRPLSGQDVVTLLAEAPVAWPNLKFLSIANPIDRYAPTRHELDAEALLHQLDVAMWTPTRPGYLRAESCERGTLEHTLLAAKHKVSDYKRAVTPFLDGFSDERWHPAIALRLAHRIVYCTRSKANMKALAKLVGLKPAPSDTREELAPRVLDAMVGLFATDGVRPTPYSDEVTEHRELLTKTSCALSRDLII